MQFEKKTYCMKDIEDCYYDDGTTEYLLSFSKKACELWSYYKLKGMESVDDYLATATDIYALSSNRKPPKRLDESKTVLSFWFEPGMFVNIGIDSPYDKEDDVFALVVGVENDSLRVVLDLNKNLNISYDAITNLCDINMRRPTKIIPINYITDIWRKDGKDETV